MHVHLCAQTCDFGQAATWFEVCSQILMAVKWRPNCARRERLNVARAPPPLVGARPPIAFGGPGHMKWPEEREVGLFEARLIEGERSLAIEVRPFFEEGFGFSRSYQRAPTGEIPTPEWIQGYDFCRGKAQCFVEETAAVHALWLTKTYLAKNETTPEIVSVKAEGPLLVTRLLVWFNRGH